MKLNKQERELILAALAAYPGAKAAKAVAEPLCAKIKSTWMTTETPKLLTGAKRK